MGEAPGWPNWVDQHLDHLRHEKRLSPRTLAIHAFELQRLRTLLDERGLNLDQVDAHRLQHFGFFPELDAFREELKGADDLASMTVAYAKHAPALGGTAAREVLDVVLAHANKVRGYFLVSAEAQAICAGSLDADLATAFESLWEIVRDPSDTDGDGVVAAVVRVMRRGSGLRDDLKKRISKVAVLTAEALRVEDAKRRITEALHPPQPDPPPTGTDGPGASDPAASPIGDRVAEANAQRDAAPQASARPRPERTSTEAQLRAYLATKGSRTELANAVSAHGERMLGTRFEALAVERAQAVCVDRDGTVLSEASAELLVRDWRERGIARRAKEAAAIAANASNVLPLRRPSQAAGLAPTGTG